LIAGADYISFGMGNDVDLGLRRFYANETAALLDFEDIQGMLFCF